MREQLATPGHEPPFKIKKRIAVYEAEIDKFHRWKKAIQELREIAEASAGRGG